MRNDLLNTLPVAGVLRGERVTKMLKVTPRGSHKSRLLSEVVLTDAVGTIEPVEKVGVRPVESPKQNQNT